MFLTFLTFLCSLFLIMATPIPNNGHTNKVGASPEPQVGVSPMITEQQKIEPRVPGYSDAPIRSMMPEQAHAILVEPPKPDAGGVTVGEHSADSYGSDGRVRRYLGNGAKPADPPRREYV